jgi:hypothetical protein
MIRDPSDGSVRIQPEPLETKALLPEKPVFGSGLQTGSTKPEYQARLEKSRKWLADYRAGPTPETAIADGESE